MTLVDTSAWVEFFRGRDPMAARVEFLLEGNAAALCGPVLTELSRGLGSERERRQVLPLLGGCADLTQPPDLWAAAGELGFQLARKGITVKTMDLLIATWAIAHDVPLLTKDEDFAAMRRGGIALVLA